MMTDGGVAAADERWDDAIEAYTKVQEMDADDIEGAKSLRKKVLKQKQAAARRTVEEHKQEGEAYLQVNDWEHAAEKFTAALEEDAACGGKQAKGLNRLVAKTKTGPAWHAAQLLEAVEEWPKAVAKYEEALELDPSDEGGRGLKKSLKAAKKAAAKDEVYPWE